MFPTPKKSKNKEITMPKHRGKPSKEMVVLHESHYAGQVGAAYQLNNSNNESITLNS